MCAYLQLRVLTMFFSKNAYFYLFFIPILLLSCQDHHSSGNTVTIDIVKPENNKVIGNPESFEFLITFSAKEAIHRINISITLQTNPQSLIYEKEISVHKSNIAFTDQLDLSAFPNDTVFLLKAFACGDHDCKGMYEKSVLFLL